MVANLVGDPSFWSEAIKVLKATIPVVRALCLINEADKPLISYIYETKDQVKEMIQKEFKYKKAEHVPYWQVINGVWNNHLHRPLHATGYFFNPSFYYLNGFYVDAEVTSGLLCCMLHMVQDCSLQNIISQQIDEYREAKGAFEQALWWFNYSGHCPELQRLAIRILSQICDGALRYGLKRSLVEKLLDNGRNPIEQQWLSDLTFVHYNHQLQRFEPGRDGKIWVEEIDLMDD
ncbi:hypothetical protein L1049_004067 [Liquidambar formosana]|uniref:Uncharacterized protein n=1 Tax=Liquidambar formosana TaxID=63359 RepID=A0AAP0RMR8_LIQFO